MTAQPTYVTHDATGGRGFARPHGKGPPRIAPMHPAPDVPATGYPTADNQAVWVQSAAICPLVLLHVHDDQGNAWKLQMSLSVFLPLAREVIALDDGDTQYSEDG